MRFRFRNEDRELEAALRANRPAPRPEFVAALAERVESTAPKTQHSTLRLGFAGGLTAALLVALASFGGLGYAAAGAANAVQSLERVAKPSAPKAVDVSAAQNQYARKVTICHHTGSKKNPTQTITVSENAVPAHQRHGDTIGPCPTGVRGAQFTPGSGVLGVSQTLPFTGFTIAFAFFMGFALVGAGAAVRRSVKTR